LEVSALIIFSFTSECLICS